MHIHSVLTECNFTGGELLEYSVMYITVQVTHTHSHKATTLGQYIGSKHDRRRQLSLPDIKHSNSPSPDNVPRLAIIYASQPSPGQCKRRGTAGHAMTYYTIIKRHDRPHNRQQAGTSARDIPGSLYAGMLFTTG